MFGCLSLAAGRGSQLRRNDVVEVRTPAEILATLDEDGCLEAVTRALSRHAALRDLVELPVDEWNQLLEGTLVAPPPFEKEPGDSRGVLRNSPF